MKVQFLKDHNSHLENDIIDVNEDRAQSWINAGIAAKVLDPAQLVASEVIALIKEATSLSELNKLVKGDNRKTVLDAYDKKHAELKG